MNNLIIGIIGPKGLVGNEIINLLYKKKYKFSKLNLYTREEENLDTLFGNIKTIKFSINNSKECDIIFLATNSEFSKEYAIILSQNSIVIDNSSAFRYNNDIPLVIPEINGDIIKNNRLIANPNCTTAIALIGIYQIYKKYGIKKLIISTYQAASGAGKEGMDELKKSFNQNIHDNKIFPKQLAYNVIPHIDEFQENGYTKEEMKVVYEIKKILNDDDIKISCTAVRIPIMRSHSESITIETKLDINIDEINIILKNTKGVTLKNDIKNNIYPTPLEFTNIEDVGIGRIRKNLIFGSKGLDLFVCGDQLLRGAALNAILIFEKILNI